VLGDYAANIGAKLTANLDCYFAPPELC